MAKDSAGKVDREGRLASALRDNLRRRKAAHRPQDEAPPPPDRATDGDGEKPRRKPESA